MQAFETLDEVKLPDGRPLTLHRRGDDFWIHLDGAELMSSRAPGTEQALATYGCAGLEKVARPRVLVGGLGFGFTVRAALEALPPRGEVVVAEKFSAVVDWNREVLGGLYAKTLANRRVKVALGDVRRCLAPDAAFDAILLDVDNGPSAWCLRSNGWLYRPPGLAALFESLCPGGTLAVWSAFEDRTFLRELRRAGFEASSKGARSRGFKGTRDIIFLGQRPKNPRRGAARRPPRRRSRR
ncbi:MAG: hypothetical protein AAF604_24195 [Acidobacteriota bacterium]